MNDELLLLSKPSFARSKKAWLTQYIAKEQKQGVKERISAIKCIHIYHMDAVELTRMNEERYCMKEQECH